MEEGGVKEGLLSSALSELGALGTDHYLMIREKS